VISIDFLRRHRNSSTDSSHLLSKYRNSFTLKFAIAKLETTIFDLHSDFDKGTIPKQYIKQMKQIDKINRDDQDKETILSVFYKELNIYNQTLLDAKVLELHNCLEPILSLNQSWLLDTSIIHTLGHWYYTYSNHQFPNLQWLCPRARVYSR
jgi:hypothetical protein